MATAPTTTWTGANNADAPTLTELVVILLDESSVVIPLRSWSPNVRIAGFFRDGFFEDPATGTFWASSQIKSIIPR